MRFFRRLVHLHKHALEVIAEAVSIDLGWALLRGLGLFGAGIASAAVVSTLTAGPAHLSPGKSLATYVYATAPHYAVDPAASLAVSTQEGGSGGIGDYGTSFGPWQMHAGGALPLSVYHGPYSSSTQSWAWSSSGVSYALRHQGAVCHGLKGYAAVSCIVSRFERPLHPAPEIAGAWRNYTAFYSPAHSPGRAKQGYHAWVDWSLGIGKYKGHKPFDRKVRPRVAKKVPHSWWLKRARYLRGHRR